ncbi:MAG: Lhr family helicase, partial [Candidatus Binataceae bacterium]
IASRARNADELYELIRAHGAIAAAELAKRVTGDDAVLIGELTAEGRVVRARLIAGTSDAADVIVAVEDASVFAAAYPRAEFDATHGVVAAVATDGSDDAPAAEEARIEIVRRALATSGPVTAQQLAARLWTACTIIEGCCATLEAKGQIFRGHFVTSSAALDANSQRVADMREDAVQWCDRYVLERIHRQTLGRLRAEVEPCADHEFAAFRLRWQRIGGVGGPGDRDEVGAVLEQLSGLAFTPELWERAILPARVPGYRPEYLDLLCMSGEIVWVAGPGGGEAGAAVDTVPSAVAFLPRQFVSSSRQRNVEPADAKERTTLEALAAGGAQFLDRVAERAGLSERDALAALWRLAAQGKVSNDSFGPLRLLWSDPGAVDALASRREHGGLSRHDAALRARLKSSLSGRWSAILAGPIDCGEAGEGGPSEARRDDTTAEADAAKEFARLLLARNGILTREMLALERASVRWHDLASVLRRMEYGGTIRRGYFVRALSGEQYALPEALEMLRAMRGGDPASANPIALSAADPANPYGVLLPGCGIARDPSNLIVVRGGRVMLGFAARALIAVERLDDASFGAALVALMALKPKLVVETIDGGPALESDRVGVMAAMRFHSDGRALVYDGLPGPAPRRRVRDPLENSSSS